MPLAAMAIESAGFEAVYVSGGAFAAMKGLPDIGLTTLDEVAAHTASIAAVTNLPLIVDADTGFGGPLNVARTVQKLEAASASAIHFEDQVASKRCGHLDGKELVDVETMCQRIRAAVAARRDPNLVIMARTDAVAVEGIDAAITRAQAYVDAGAEMIFPEALTTRDDFQKFRVTINVPLLANMTEFGKSPLLTTNELQALGYNLVIYPVTTLRLAMKVIADGLDSLATHHKQDDVLISQMQTRNELYKLLKYEEYQILDNTIAGGILSPLAGEGNIGDRSYVKRKNS